VTTSDQDIALQVVPCQHGIVPIEDVFGKGAHSLVAGLNVEGQHRGAVAAARAQVSCCVMICTASW
jgi:hypothetical protein